MPLGDKSKYTNKQERKADHIAEGYEKRGVPEKEAERRAWATVNKDDGGGKIPAGPAAASLSAIQPPIRAAQPRRPARRTAALCPRKRQWPRASAMPSLAPDRRAVPVYQGPV
jgi:hypothetical protein